MSKIYLSAFADEYSRDLDKQIKVLRDNGIGYTEPRFIGDKNISALTASEAKDLYKKLSDNGIKAVSLGSPLGKINLADDFSMHLDMAKRLYENANILETKNVRMFSFYLREGQTREDARGEVLEKLDELITLAEKYSVTLCHENEADIYGESEEHCLDILSYFGGRMRAVFDMGNFALMGYKPFPKGYEMLRDYIEYFHIKDSLSAGAIVPPGCGEASIKEILSAYKKDMNKDFVITLEPHLETFSGLNALTDRTFVNPYKFESGEVAFLEAIRCIKEIVASID